MLSPRFADLPHGGDAAAVSSASTLTNGTARVTTLASQAERTITPNPGNTALLFGQDWVFGTCFGCSSDTSGRQIMRLCALNTHYLVLPPTLAGTL